MDKGVKLTFEVKTGLKKTEQLTELCFWKEMWSVLLLKRTISFGDGIYRVLTKKLALVTVCLELVIKSYVELSVPLHPDSLRFLQTVTWVQSNCTLVPVWCRLHADQLVCRCWVCGFITPSVKQRRRLTELCSLQPPSHSWVCRAADCVCVCPCLCVKRVCVCVCVCRCRRSLSVCGSLSQEPSSLCLY